MYFEKIVKGLAIFIFCFCSFFGVFVLSIIIHEISHMQDFQKLSLSNESIYILNFKFNQTSIEPSWDEIGYYQAKTNISKDDTQLVEIKKYTELKAYFMMSITFLIWFVSVTLILVHKTYES